jgi:hypothetical protein
VDYGTSLPKPVLFILAGPNDPLRLVYQFTRGALAHADPDPPQWAAELYGGHLA